jgi:hypothetical protein
MFEVAKWILWVVLGQPYWSFGWDRVKDPYINHSLLFWSGLFSHKSEQSDSYVGHAMYLFSPTKKT